MLLCFFIYFLGKVNIWSDLLKEIVSLEKASGGRLIEGQLVGSPRAGDIESTGYVCILFFYILTFYIKIWVPWISICFVRFICFVCVFIYFLVKVTTWSDLLKEIVSLKKASGGRLIEGQLVGSPRTGDIKSTDMCEY